VLLYQIFTLFSDLNLYHSFLIKSVRAIEEVDLAVNAENTVSHRQNSGQNHNIKIVNNFFRM
jgi:hypothetical protein